MEMIQELKINKTINNKLNMRMIFLFMIIILKVMKNMKRN